MAMTFTKALLETLATFTTMLSGVVAIVFITYSFKRMDNLIMILKAENHNLKKKLAEKIHTKEHEPEPQQSPNDTHNKTQDPDDEGHAEERESIAFWKSYYYYSVAMARNLYAENHELLKQCDELKDEIREMKENGKGQGCTVPMEIIDELFVYRYERRCKMDNIMERK